MIRTYMELIQLPTFKERFEYLKLNGVVGKQTFGYERYLNQILYTSSEWRRCRNKVIVRDNSCDLGCEGYDIYSRPIIHHINPITVEDILDRKPIVFDLNNLVCVSHETHNAIHYGDESLLAREPIARSKNDTCPWRHRRTEE